MIRLRRRVFVLGLGALGLVACGSSSSAEGGATAGSVVPASKPLPSTGKPVPAALDQVEAQAEDIGDLVPGQHWEQIASDVKTISDSWAAYEAQAAADGAPRSLASALTKSIDDLSTATAAKQGAATSQAANDVSAAIVELYGLYDTGRPVNVGRLDVIGRQIALDAAAKDTRGVLEQIGRARREWAAIEQDVDSHNGGDVSARTNAVLLALTERAQQDDFTAVTAQANTLLELVDDMEGLF